MLKCDEKFLYVLLTLSQEQNIKTGRFSMIYADEVVVSHTNETRVHGVRRQQAESRRCRTASSWSRCPTTCASRDEVQDLREAAAAERAARACTSRRTRCDVASIFAVLSRLEPSQEGRHEPDEEAQALRRRGGRGLQARRTSGSCRRRRCARGWTASRRATSSTGSPARWCATASTCINPIDALRALRDGLEQHTGITREQRERYLNLIAEARREYDEMAKKEVQRAFVYSFEESAQDAAEQLPGQRRGVLQQAPSCATRSPRRRSSRTSS